MSYEFFNPGEKMEKGEKKDFGPGLSGNVRVVFRKHAPSKADFQGKVTPLIRYSFVCPKTDKWCSASTNLSLKVGSRGRNMLIALSGNELPAEILTDRSKIEAFLNSCLGKSYDVITEAKGTWSNILWDTKHRPLLALAPDATTSGMSKISKDDLPDFGDVKPLSGPLAGNNDDDSGVPF